MANIIIPTPLRKFTDNEAIIRIGGATVKDSVIELVEKYPDLSRQLLDAEGNIRKFVKIYVGDEDIATLDNEDTAVNDDATISIIPAIAGGSNA